MGIQGLLPFLSNSTRDAQISEFENEFVAIDAYCWLHKGVYSCCVEIAMKNPTTKYVTYCMRYIDMLLYFKVKPILVFDGKKLSSKEETERKRREERKSKYKRGLELIKAGKMNEGRKLLGESVDITHELAVTLMKECRKRNIDCIVAPYEADAQLAYLSLNNIVKCVITEDSDLLVYGCERVMFKMDTSGRGKLVEKNQIHLSLDMEPEEYNEDKLRYMCILSGCDYLPSLPSIGPVNALKFVKMLKDKNIYEVLPKLPIYLNKLKASVSPEYIQGFRIADRTFKHQIVYNPFKRKEVPLLPVENDDDIVGEKLPEDLAFQLAIGNIDPITMKKLDDYDPDECGKGFRILWSQKYLPNAVPRQSTMNQYLKPNDAKKRQREGCEPDTVPGINNDLKKHCLFQNIPSSKKIITKKTVNHVPKTGILFEPEKKNSLKTVDESELLNSRYFFSSKPKRNEKKEPAKKSDRRKDETYEEYLQRLYSEHFEENDEAEEASNQSQDVAESHRKSNNTCSCGLDSNSCQCNECGEISATQRLNHVLKEYDEHKRKNTLETSHSLLEEINKDHETSKEEKTESPCGSEELEKKPVEESFAQKLSITLSNYLSIKGNSAFEDVDKTDMEVDIVLEKENKKDVDVVVENRSEVKNRTPSPVFKVQKDSKVLNSSCRFGNVADTAATPTSVYFSATNSRNFQRSKSLISVKQTPVSSNRKLPSLRSFGSTSSKTGKLSSSVNRTLFQFGFKKKLKEEEEKEGS